MDPFGPRRPDVVLKVVHSSIKRSNLAATVNRENFQGLDFPCLARVRKEGAPAGRAIWLYGYPRGQDGQPPLGIQDDPFWEPEPDGRDGGSGEVPVAEGQIFFTKRARDELGLERKVKVVVEWPTFVGSVRVVLPSARDLPEALAVNVEPDVFKAFKKDGKRDTYALLTAGGIAIPVRLVEQAALFKRLNGNAREYEVQMTSTVRAACGLIEDTGWRVQLAKLPMQDGGPDVRPAAPAARTRRKRGVAAAAGLLRRSGRLLDLFVEDMLRWALRAPPLAFRTVKSGLGDDDLRDTVRLHQDALDALAAKPGGQVILSWADREVAVRVLTLTDPYEPPGLGLAAVDPDSPEVPDGFPPQRLVSIPPSVRRTLDIPPATVVEIRRRLRTALLSQANQLIIPVTGLILAAVVIPLKWWQILTGVVIVLVLALTPLRIPKPPLGRWR